MRRTLRFWRRPLGVRDSLSPQPGVGIVTAGLAVMALLLAWHETMITLGGMPVFAVFLSIALAMAVVVAYRYPVHIRHQTKVFLFTVPYYILAVLVPPPLAALAAGLGALVGEISRHKTSGAYPSDIATEAGRRVPQVLVTSLVAHAGGSPPTFLALLGSVGVLALIEAISFPLVLAPMSRERPLRAMVVGARASAVAEGVLYVVALIGAAAAVTYPWTLPLLIVPASLVYVACNILQRMHESTRLLLENMADAVDLRDPYTGGHSRRVAEYTAQILQALALHGPEVDLILMAARVHDIGKIGVPDAVLHKSGLLTAEERAAMELHPVHGVTLLKRHRDFARGSEMVRHHHERWDGAGYPDRLAEVAIPFGARVIAVADSYDAMTSDRPYRRGMSLQKATDILREGRATQWDAAIVDAFLISLADRVVGPAPVSATRTDIPVAPGLVLDADRERIGA